MRAQIDDAVARHAAVEQQILGRHQPVADVIGEDALARARDLARQVRVPPHVIDVDREAQSRRRAGRRDRWHGRACSRRRGRRRTSDAAARSRAARRRRAHRAAAPQCRRGPAAMRAGEVLRALRQAAGDQHQAARADGGGLVDGAAVVVERGAAAGLVGGGKQAGAAVAGHGQARAHGSACRPSRRPRPARCRATARSPVMPARDAALDQLLQASTASPSPN